MASIIMINHGHPELSGHLGSKGGDPKEAYVNLSQLAHGWQIGWHWLAGNSHFPCGRIFIFCFSEPLGINSEVLNRLLLGKGLFI